MKRLSALMEIMVQSLNNETDTLIKNNIRLTAIGDIERLSDMSGKDWLKQ